MLVNYLIKSSLSFLEIKYFRAKAQLILSTDGAKKQIGLKLLQLKNEDRYGAKAFTFKILYQYQYNLFL